MVITSDFSPYTIEEHATEEDWLNARSAVREGEWSISSTEASTVMGVNPWMSAAELYDIICIMKKLEMMKRRYLRQARRRLWQGDGAFNSRSGDARAPLLRPRLQAL